jgi:hypothetical protein
MMMKSNVGGRFHWRLPLYSMFGALIGFLPRVVWSVDVGPIVYLFVAVPIVTLALIFVGMRAWDANSRLSILWLAVIYGVLSWVLFVKADDLRVAGRWLYEANAYKAEVLSLPVNEDGSFRHIEWERSGFAGVANNVVYIVYDPGESLSAAAANHSPGKFNGIPCAVFWVRRLESHWHSVDFFTDHTDWRYCD